MVKAEIVAMSEISSETACLSSWMSSLTCSSSVMKPGAIMLSVASKRLIAFCAVSRFNTLPGFD